MRRLVFSLGWVALALGVIADAWLLVMLIRQLGS
jgi:hypothetical protein